jgi:hypothetical protein
MTGNKKHNAGLPRGKNGYRYRQQYGVIVICKNERHQARVYNVLRRRGLDCKVVTV